MIRRLIIVAFLWIGWIGLLAVSVGAVQLWVYWNVPSVPAGPPPTVNIREGMGPKAIAKYLEEQGVISRPELFYWIARWTRTTHRLQAGEYRFEPLSPPSEILRTLVQGRVLVHRVTIPEGSTLNEVCALVEAAGLSNARQLKRLAQDPQFLKSLEIPHAPSLEGYLFPETYYFRSTERSEDILRRMVEEFRRHFPPVWRDRARRMGFTIHQVVTLASLVEKEARVDKERPLIASVFLNRLKIGMPLQSDPTAVYDLEGFKGPITHRHLKRESPYNTYLHKGLPPGPICNPGENSLRAVLFPAKTSYLYFVSNRDGTHTFSSHYRDHQRAVARYRKKGKSRADP